MSVSVLKQETPIARKEHRCMFCGGGIKKGEKYSHEVFITDGDIDDQKMHLCCNKAVKEFFDPYDEYLDVDCIMDCLNETLKDKGIEPSKTIYDAVQQWSELTCNINTLKQ